MGKDKGGAFERSQARFISLWWSYGDKDDLFWRNRTRITSKSVNAERQCGDLQAFHTIGLPFTEVFNVELKTGYSKKKTDSTKKKLAAGKAVKPQKVRNTPWDLLEVIDSNVIDDNLVILQFWGQCKSDAEMSCRIPLLIFKRDFHEPVVVIDGITRNMLADYAGHSGGRYLILQDPSFVLFLYRHADFFEWISPDAVKAIHKMSGGRPMTNV